MIKSIFLRNFQAHRRTKLEFAPGVNAIAGASDQGKSSIIRALRWVVENRPAGDSFRSNFAGNQDTEVVVETTDGETVTRTKGPKTNSYSVKGKELKAMGQSVPEEVSASLRLGSVNFQHQMDAPFLLSLGSSKLSQYLNEVAGLDAIDRATSNIRKRILGNSQDQRTIEAQKAATATALEKFQGLDEIEGRLVAAEGLEGQINANSQKERSLRSCLVSVQADSDFINPLKKIVEAAAGPVKQVEEMLTEIGEAGKKITALDSVLSSIATAKAAKNKLSNPIKKSGPLLKTAMKLQDDFDGAAEQYRMLAKQIRSIENLQTEMLSAKKELKEARIEYEAAIPDQCPFCGGKIDRKKMQVSL